MSASQEKNYSLQIYNRGEEMTYSDVDIELELERTYCRGNRLFCDNTQADSQENPIPLKKRIEIIDNLCDFFESKKSKSIFVLHEADKDQSNIEMYISSLIQKGHKLVIEKDSAKKQQKRLDDMYIGILKAGKVLNIKGVEINSVDEYWKWKENG